MKVIPTLFIVSALTSAVVVSVATTQSTIRCVSAVSTAGSPFIVFTPEGEEISRHNAEHTAQVAATNAAIRRPGEIFLVERSYQLRVSFDPACTVSAPDTSSPVVPPVENLIPDSIAILGDSVELSIGETIRFPLVVWWTIPQEADMGSRPFLCFGGSHGLDYGLVSPNLPSVDGWVEIAFPYGYPSTTWIPVEEGHTFDGECMSADVVASPTNSA